MISSDRRNSKRRRSWVARKVAVVLGAMIGMVGPSQATDARSLFTRHCASCHGPDGKAHTPIGHKLGVKDLTQSKATDAEMERQLIEGTKDKKGQQRMPPFKEKLSPAEMTALIEWVKKLRK